MTLFDIAIAPSVGEQPVPRQERPALARGERARHPARRAPGRLPRDRGRRHRRARAHARRGRGGAAAARSTTPSCASASAPRPTRTSPSTGASRSPPSAGASVLLEVAPVTASRSSLQVRPRLPITSVSHGRRSRSHTGIPAPSTLRFEVHMGRWRATPTYPTEGRIARAASLRPPVCVQTSSSPGRSRRSDCMSFDVAMARIAQLQTPAAPAAAAPAATAAPRPRRPRFATQLQNAAARRRSAPPPRSARRPQRARRSSTWSSRRSASPSSRPAPTTPRASRSSARRPPAPASARGARTSPPGPRARRASRSATTARASAASTTSTPGRRRPARPSRTARGVKPQPGDLIVWDEHIGVVESVGADGTINTIEGNSSDQVSQRTYAPGARPAIGYVRLG